MLLLGHTDIALPMAEGNSSSSPSSAEPVSGDCDESSMKVPDNVCPRGLLSCNFVLTDAIVDRSTLALLLCLYSLATCTKFDTQAVWEAISTCSGRGNPIGCRSTCSKETRAVQTNSLPAVDASQRRKPKL